MNVDLRLAVAASECQVMLATTASVDMHVSCRVIVYILQDFIFSFVGVGTNLSSKS
jgi:hypothetical protein